jgi:hypothetical protein
MFVLSQLSLVSDSLALFRTFFREMNIKSFNGSSSSHDVSIDLIDGLYRGSDSLCEGFI